MSGTLLGATTFAAIGVLFLLAAIRGFTSTLYMTLFGDYSNETVGLVALGVFAASILAGVVGWRASPRRAIALSGMLLVGAGILATIVRWNWGELREYCRCVAGAVGLACAAVYGPSDPEAAAPHAQTLGLALQQINIMRDVAEDWRLGRVYLPQDELAEFNVSEGDIAAGRVGAEWRALMEHQGERAEALLREGLELLPLLDRRSALCVRAFAGIYRGLLVQMRGRGYDVFSSRPQLSAVGKVRAVAAL